MGLHGPRIEELATRKVRLQQPQLAEQWNVLKEDARRHQLLLRRVEKEDRQRLGELEGETGKRRGHSQSLKLSRTHSDKKILL